MTTEPKFVPENAVGIEVGSVKLNVKLVDCVGYNVEGAEGAYENGKIREVMTPWSEDPIPFDKAAEIGTEKVIKDHSTVAVLVTTDGSFGDLGRENFIPAEERIAAELSASGKPFITILNCKDPENENSERLGLSLEKKYGAPVALVNCTDIDMSDIENILGMLLYEFPLCELEFKLPDWLCALDKEHTLRSLMIKAIENILPGTNKLSDVTAIDKNVDENGLLIKFKNCSVSLGEGKACIETSLDESVFYSVIEEMTSYNIKNRADILRKLIELSKLSDEFDKYSDAIRDVERCGYGIVMPTVDDMELEEPEIVKQQGSYGVKLRAGAASVHLIKTKIETEVCPIVGTEKQSEELIEHLLSEFENDASLIWDSNIFGKSLYELVKDGLHTKLLNMPDDSRAKIADTLSRIINEGSQGLICIIL